MGDKELQRHQTGQADAGTRAMRAWSARVSGHTWQESAELSGFTTGAAACRAVRSYFGTLPEVGREDARDLWRARHEQLWAIALRDARTGRSGAVRAATAVARSAAQLDALDTPVVSVTVNPTAAEFELVVGRLVALQRGDDEPVEADVVAMPEGAEPWGDTPPFFPDDDPA